MKLRSLAFWAVVALSAGCSAAIAESPSLTNAARSVRTGKADPDPTMKEIGPIEATNGSGCGYLGAKGSYEGAMNELRNKAAMMGAAYVQIYTFSEPHSAGGCFTDAFTIRGMAFRVARYPAPPYRPAQTPPPPSPPAGPPPPMNAP
jgi:hypothetical protein